MYKGLLQRHHAYLTCHGGLSQTCGWVLYESLCVLTANYSAPVHIHAVFWERSCIYLSEGQAADFIIDIVINSCVLGVSSVQDIHKVLLKTSFLSTLLSPPPTSTSPPHTQKETKLAYKHQWGNTKEIHPHTAILQNGHAHYTYI